MAKWDSEEVLHWALLCAGVSKVDADKVSLSGVELLKYPWYPTDDLEAALVSRGVSPEGVACIATAYQEQRWTTVTEVIGSCMCRHG